MAKVITPATKDKYYSPVTYGQFCLDTNHDSLDDFIQSQIHDIIDRVYPIGAYYISTDAVSPAVLFNYGNWELLEEGRTILGAGAKDDISAWETKTLTDGSKWAKVYYQDANTAWTAIEETSLIYDRLQHLNKFYTHLSNDSGHMELLMEYEGLNLKARWQQRAYPFSWDANLNDQQDAVISRSSYTATSVEEGCYIPSQMTTSNGFFGLGKSGSSLAEISGYPGSTSHAFGLRNKSRNSSSHTYIYAGNAGYETVGVTLWIRYDNVIRWGVEAGTTGGNASITLLTTQIPSHRHGIGFIGYRYPGGNDDHASGTNIGSQVTTNTGGSKAHNNLQPYTKVFVWRRIEEPMEDIEEQEV